MSKILRALLISAVATAGAAVVVHLLQQPSQMPALQPSVNTEDPGIIDADRIPQAEKDALLNELSAQL